MAEKLLLSLSHAVSRQAELSRIVGDYWLRRGREPGAALAEPPPPPLAPVSSGLGPPPSLDAPLDWLLFRGPATLSNHAKGVLGWALLALGPLALAKMKFTK